MNVGKRSKDSGRSSIAKNTLFRALGHVHNPFSTNSHGDHDVYDYKQDENIGNVRAMSLQAEAAKAEAYFIAWNLAARLQKS